jgi:hypothetical protein
MKYFIYLLILIGGIAGFYAYDNKSELETSENDVDSSNEDHDSFDPSRITIDSSTNNNNLKQMTNSSNNGSVQGDSGFAQLGRELPPTIYLRPENKNKTTFDYLEQNFVTYDGDFYMRPEDEPTEEEVELARSRFNRAPAGIDQNPFVPNNSAIKNDNENEPEIESEINNKEETE